VDGSGSGRVDQACAVHHGRPRLTSGTGVLRQIVTNEGTFRRTLEPLAVTAGHEEPFSSKPPGR